MMSANSSTMYVWFGDFPVQNFKKDVLLNLVQSAENVSSTCKKIVFICNRQADSYAQFKNLLSVIDSERMTKSQIG
jgi:hypothetical protein